MTPNKELLGLLGEAWFPHGISIGPKQQVRLLSENCEQCGKENFPYSPCLTVKGMDTQGVIPRARFENYHFPKCFFEFKSEAYAVNGAISLSSYPKKEKVLLSHQFTALKENDTIEIESRESKNGLGSSEVRSVHMSDDKDKSRGDGQLSVDIFKRSF